jgi:hypothetical protein
MNLPSLTPLKGPEALKKVANDRTLFVTIPKESEKFPCSMLAKYVLHAAQDGGYGNICIVKSSGAHKHNFKTIDVVKRTKEWSGPSLVGLKMRDDCWHDERRKIWVLGHKPNPDATISRP